MLMKRHLIAGAAALAVAGATIAASDGWSLPSWLHRPTTAAAPTAANEAAPARVEPLPGERAPLPDRLPRHRRSLRVP